MKRLKYNKKTKRPYGALLWLSLCFILYGLSVIQLGRLRKIINLPLRKRKWFFLIDPVITNKDLATLGITGLFFLRVQIDRRDWHLDVGLKYL